MKELKQFISLFRQPAQIWSSDGRVLLSNSSFNALFGLPSSFDWNELDYNFRNDEQVIQAGADKLLENAIAGRYVEIHSLDYVPARNPVLNSSFTESLKLFLSLQPLIAENGMNCIVCVVSDYRFGGELMEQQLVRSQKMENLETLANGIAHEFNNLLTGIKGMTSLIMDEAERDSEIQGFAKAIDESIERGANLINKLLSYSRELPYMLKRTNVTEYFRDSMTMLQLQLSKRIRFEMRMLANAEVMLDRQRIDQVISSLLVNSRNAMGKTGQIIISVSHQSPLHDQQQVLDMNWVCISIEDSGTGIPAELQERVFEPFFTTSQKANATGLGLSVANKIIKLHNGIMQAGSSEELGGAAVRIYLPTATASLAASAVNSAQKPQA